jgi:hypothetical protein
MYVLTLGSPLKLGWFHGVIPLVSRKPLSNSIERRALHYVAGARVRNVDVLSVHGRTAQVLCIS